MSSGGMLEIGKYKILERIGEGAMGVVYRALDPVINRPVAIKIMADSVARDDVLRGRFLREAQAAGSLQHPNVVTIYDFGEVDGHLYIAMEFIDGEDLESMQVNKRPLTILQKLDIIIDVLGGLAYAHKRGVVHRDIKPANIRIDTEGRARIMDFGIAHLSSSRVTRTGTTVGTPAYMAPEQISGGDIVPASDLFSVGAMMFELLSGRKAFDAESLHSIFFNIVSAPAPHLSEFASDLPSVLDDIVQKSLAKEPGDRYGSALEMANALTAVRREIDSAARKSGSVSLRAKIDQGLATRPTVPINPMKRPRRNVVYIGAGGGVIAVGIAVALLLPKRNPSTTPELPAQSTQAPSPATTSAPSPITPPTTAQGIPASVTPAGKPEGSPPPKTSPPREAAKTAPVVSPRDLEVFRSMQSTALDARRRAAEAGASADQLQVGDDENDRAAAFAMGGRTVDAAARLNAATRAWLKAESDARAAAAAAATTAKQRSVEPEKPPVTTPPVTQVSPPIVAPPPVAAATPASNPAAEIAAAVAAYAHAVELRDINEVRRAFPGVSAAQVSGFEQFFSSVRSLRATMTLGTLDLQATTAEGRVTGQYDYVTTGGKTERQPLDFQATFRRDGTVWKLVAVRANR